MQLRLLRSAQPVEQQMRALCQCWCIMLQHFGLPLPCGDDAPGQKDVQEQI
jgi:hypothetical protein